MYEYIWSFLTQENPEILWKSVLFTWKFPAGSKVLKPAACGEEPDRNLKPDQNHLSFKRRWIVKTRFMMKGWEGLTPDLWPGPGSPAFGPNQNTMHHRLDQNNKLQDQRGFGSVWILKMVECYKIIFSFDNFILIVYFANVFLIVIMDY